MINMPKVMDQLVHKMGWQIKRASVLNQNLANIETPGFKRQEIEAYRAPSSNAPKIPMNFRVAQSPHESSREREIMELTENATSYQSNLQLFRKYLSLIKTVTGHKGSGM